ncbi:MAG TPA: hypothetical protein V6D47_10970 [Oscillatoriaceae cyanobacterium]
MDQPPKKKEPKLPTWTEQSVPERVRPGQTHPLESSDIDGLLPAADPVVKAGYGRSGTLPTRPLLNREGDGTDALVIQRGTRHTRVLNFEAEGVHWRAGFAHEPVQTPIGQYLPSPLPPETELQPGNGFVLRPVENALEVVLRDMLPRRLGALEEEMFGHKRDLGHTYLYFIPQPSGATVGMIAWYLAGPSSKAHLVYLQTDVRKADTRLLDEMLKTFRASLAARQEPGASLRSFDFWAELREASVMVESTLRNSSIARNSAEVKQRVSAARDRAESRLYQGLTGSIEVAGVALAFLAVRVPQMAIAGLVRGGSRAIVWAVKAVDGLLGGKREGPYG